MVFQTVLVHPFMRRLFELELCALMPRNAHNPLNMVNEPGKVPNLNTGICRVYVHHRKKLMEKLGKKFGIPFNLGDFPLETMELPR